MWRGFSYLLVLGATWAVFLFIIAILAALFLLSSARAGDPTGYWARKALAGEAPGKEWWDALASTKGLCCSFADGQQVNDVDWRSGGEGYQVFMRGKWIDVPDSALVREPNKFGPAVVWPYMDGAGEMQIRCFLPGAGT
jgi:hypothetical protein